MMYYLTSHRNFQCHYDKYFELNCWMQKYLLPRIRDVYVEECCIMYMCDDVMKILYVGKKYYNAKSLCNL